jgi:multisubunit Na+/H+ antiporter MnhC subunit
MVRAIPITPTPKVEPFPTALVVASVVLVAVIGISLLVYFKKRSHAGTKKHSEIVQPST